MSEKVVTIQYVIEDDVSKGLDKIKKKGQNTFNKVGKGAKKAEKNIKRMSNTNFKPMIGSLTRIAGIMGLGMGLKGVIDTRVAYENFQAVLGNLYQDVGKGQAKLDALTQFAVKTPNTLENMMESFIKLKSFGIEPTEDQLMSLSDLGASFGKSVMTATEAVTGAMVGENERLKQFGITTKVAGDKVTFMFKGQKTTVDKNQESIRNYLLTLGKLPGIAGASTKQMDTLGGVISNMKDSAFNAMVALGGMSRNGLVGVFKGISKLLQSTPKIIKWFEKWGYVIKPVVAALAGFFIITKVIKMVKGLTIAIKALNLAMNANPFVLIATLLIGVGVALYELSKKFGGFKNMFAAFGKTIGGFFKGLWADIKTIGLNVGHFFRDIGLKVAEFVQNIVNKFKNLKIFLGALFTEVGLTFKIFFTKIGDKFEMFWLKIKKFGEGIKNFFKQVGEALTLVAQGQFGKAMDVMANKMENKFDKIIADKKKEQEDNIKDLEGQKAEATKTRKNAFQTPQENKVTDFIEAQKKKDEEQFKLLRQERESGYLQSKSMAQKIGRVIKGNKTGTEASGVNNTVSGVNDNVDGSGNGSNGLGSGVGELSSSRNVRSVTLTIDKLIETLNINTTTLKESTPEIRQQVIDLLQRAVVDAKGFQN